MEALRHPSLSRIDDMSSSIVLNHETSAAIYIVQDEMSNSILLESRDQNGSASSSNANHLSLGDTDEDDVLEQCTPPASETLDFIEFQDVADIAKDKVIDVSREYAVHSSKILIKEVLKRAEGGDYSSSSEGTADNQNSGQTYPETPPTPLSFESRSSSQSSTASSGSGIVLSQSPSKGGELPPHILSIPLSDSNYSNPRSLKMSLSGNRLPDCVRRSRTEIMGRSIFSCFNGDVDTISPSNSIGNYKAVFRRRSEKKINSCDSEEALEMAAQKIRNQLLLTEMVELAAKAERAADSGYDRFTGYPLCVFPEDLPEQQRRRRRAPSIRRSFSEGAYAPSNSGTASPRRMPSNLSGVSELAPSASITTIPISEVRKVDAVKLRDINDVVPKFSSFHRHLRTHFFRSDVFHQQLLFQEGLAPVPDAVKKHPVLTSSNSDDAMSLLPMCSNEITSTPLPPVRKSVVPSSPSSSIPPPIHGFLKHFRLDHPWAVAPNFPSSPSNSESLLGKEDPNAADRQVMDSLSEQVYKSQTSQVPRKIDVLPGLADQNYVPRSTIRLQPKMGRRSMFTGASEASQELCLNPDVADSVIYLDMPATDSRALLDETECDSFDEHDSLYADQCDSLGFPRQSLMPNDRDDSSSSLLDDAVLMLTPHMGNASYLERRNSSLSPEEEGSGSLPVPTMIPDFVTPVRLRKIRGTAFVPSVVLSMQSTEGSSNALPLETCPALPIAVRPSTLVEPMAPLLDVSSDSTDDVLHHPTTLNYSEALKGMKRLDESMTATVTTEATSKTSDVSLSNLPGEDTPIPPETAELAPDCRECPVVDSVADDKNLQRAQPTKPVLPVIPKSIGCHSFGGFASTRGHDDWVGCLSLSPELTPVSVADNGVKWKEALPKSPSTGALDDLKSWNEFVEQFGMKSHSSHSSHRSTSVPRHSIREAMELLSSKLSPKKCHRHDSKHRALYARMKENDEFMSNFLYCSKPNDGDVVSTTMDDVPPTKGFLCIDGSMTCGGDSTTEAVGYCCTTSWLEDALHLGWRPGHPQRCVQLSRRPVPPPQPHGSSWMDLAQLDGGAPTGHGVFQAPSLKKTRNLGGRSSRNPKNVRHHSQWMTHAQTWNEDMHQVSRDSDA